MNSLVRQITGLLLISLLVSQCLGFGTGSHFDLTRMVLAERRFRDTPVRIVQVENWLTDYYANNPTYGEKHRAVLEKLHFDNLFDEGQVRSYWAILLRNLRSATEEAAGDNDPFSMLVILGMGLHAVQDFYSHSNWAELHPPSTGGEFRLDTFAGALGSPNAGLVKGLHTGKFPSDRKKGPGPLPIPVGVAVHGGYHDGLNKDSPMQAHWDEAFVFAYAGSYELLRAMEEWAETARPGFWKSVREYAIDAAAEKKLAYDVAAARNMSMWLEGKGQDGTWKGEGSGSTRFFTKFSSNWMTEDSSIFVRAVREGRVQDLLTADLYSESAAGEVFPIEPFAEERIAIIVRATYVAEGKESSYLERKVTSGLGGSDFYSRIKIGEQEFWGRVIQKSREVYDPWYEILILDQKTDEVPIVISVWDEDHTDSAKDAHVDINPAADTRDLRMIFRIADGSLSGDIDGVFNTSDRTFLSAGEKSAKPRGMIRAFVTRQTIKRP